MKRAVGMSLALLLILGVLSGCTYVKDRAYDLADVTGFKVLSGYGMKIGAGFLPVVSPMLAESNFLIYPLAPGFDSVPTGLYFGYYDFQKYGYHGRAAGIWKERGWEIAVPIDHQIKPEWGNHFLFDSAHDYQDRDVFVPDGKVFDHILSYPKSRYHHWGDIQLTAFACFGLEFNFSPFEMCDFIFGFFHLDMAQDDTRNYTPIGRREE